eukprot:TRINITY_DN642_c0_g1_i2.p1 TRINITY_DN642_c0_g1~~TRINITY_DN642_c0_g1_i2.p1  ORF type:complete len:351 (-),score=52.93 TRINITY_DN642_c0_g1_i2:315-1367(-)
MSSEEEPPIQIKVEVESEQDPINVNYNEVLERRILEQKNAKRDDTCCFSPTPKDYDCNYFCSGRFMIQSIPTVFVLGLLGYGLYVYLFLYCVLLLEGALADKIQGYAFSVTFSIAFVLTLVSYIRCIITNPGAIPDGFPSAITTEEGSLLEAFVGDKKPLMEKKKRTGEPRYCAKCEENKPDRCHHCSHCNRCVLKMDHHCPWVNNCVGWGNQKFFILFLFWGSVMCLFAALSLAPYIFMHFQDLLHGQLKDIQLLIGFLLYSLFGICLMLFAAMHFHLSCSNLTTIEQFAKNSLKRRRKVYDNIYDLGDKKENFTQVFGTSPLFWFIPIFTTPGDGLCWPTNDSFISNV